MTRLATPILPNGTVLGDRYEVVRHIARGGMGDVYEAADPVLRRSVAVKLFRSASPVDRARFDAEVHVLAGLGHPGLVRVYDAGPSGDDAYVVLELIDGPSLASCLAADGPMPTDEVARLGAELADALAYIHEHGVVHRDVTPANVLRDPDGRPRLVDFGIARLLDAPRFTTTSLAIGTPTYMSPEQLQGGTITPATDVYALGLVLIEALTGRPAFEGTVQETAMARLASGPDLPADLPGHWRGLLTGMTHRQPGSRPGAEQVRDRLRALDSAATTQPIAAAGLATTAAVPITDAVAVAGGGGTTVMPVPLLPLEEGPAAAPAHRRRWRWAPIGVALVVAAIVGVVALAAAGTDGVRVPPTTPSSTVEPAGQERTSATDPPVTTLAPTTTVAPVVEGEGDGFPFEPGSEPPGVPKRGKKAGDQDD